MSILKKLFGRTNSPADVIKPESPGIPEKANTDDMVKVFDQFGRMLQEYLEKLSLLHQRHRLRAGPAEDLLARAIKVISASVATN